VVSLELSQLKTLLGPFTEDKITLNNRQVDFSETSQLRPLLQEEVSLETLSNSSSSHKEDSLELEAQVEVAHSLVEILEHSLLKTQVDFLAAAVLNRQFRLEVCLATISSPTRLQEAYLATTMPSQQEQEAYLASSLKLKIRLASSEVLLPPKI
jgi:hypothetical protein